MTRPSVVVGVDGSDMSLRAVLWAADEAAVHGLPLRVVHVSGRAGDANAARTGRRSPERARAERVVETAAERARRHRPRTEVSAELLPGDPVSVLLREGRGAGALVVGERGIGAVAGLLLGSVGAAVTASAPCPVVVVRGDGADSGAARGRILLGVAEPEDGPAVRFAFHETAARDCVLDAVHAWRCPPGDRADHPRVAGEPHLYCKARAATLIDHAVARSVRDHPAVRLRSAAVEGTATEVLVRCSAAADLIVVGTHRRRTRLGSPLGRVARTLLHHADCPVAVVPPEARPGGGPFHPPRPAAGPGADG
ncbi:universal stress protein [Streptomyces sp. NPDC052042]|uniref:universal stress protein n=1 Tax=Streptomyces sp. NPDC052042 TaxID=3365683 RepID=UPI0037D21873